MNAREETNWVCGVCEHNYHDKDAALECCAYACSNCEQNYSSEDDRDNCDCCDDDEEEEEQEWFACKVCGAEYDNSGEEFICCEKAKAAIKESLAKLKEISVIGGQAGAAADRRSIQRIAKKGVIKRC